LAPLRLAGLKKLVTRSDSKEAMLEIGQTRKLFRLMD